MINFLRRMRLNFITNSKTGKYLLYAVGEIFLVIVGILIALQVNNQNSKRLEDEKIRSYYERIIEDIDETISSIENHTVNNDSIITNLIALLEILKNNDLSKIEEFKYHIGYLGTAWSLELSYPVITEFINEGYVSKIKSAEIKENFYQFKLASAYIMRSSKYLTDQYQNIIEPFIIKNMNYSEVALPSYTKLVVAGGPKTNVNDLFENMELWNILTLKLEIQQLHKKKHAQFIELLNKLRDSILQELQNA